MSNSLWRLAQVLGGGGLSALTVLLYARLLPKEQYGVYGTLATIAGVAQMLATFGLRTGLSRFVARSFGKGDPGRARAYVQAALRIGAVSAAVVALLLTGVGVIWGAGMTAGLPVASLLLPLVGAVLARSAALLLQGGLEGTGSFRELSIASLSQAALVLLLVGLLSIGKLDIARIVAAEAVAAAVSGIWIFRMLERRLPPSGGAPRREVTSELVAFGLPLLVNGVAGFLYSRVDLLFIHAWLTAADTADYFLMLNLFDFPLLVLGAYVSALSVDVARAAGAGEHARIWRLFWRSELMGLCLGLALAGVFFGASFVVPLLLPEYGAAMTLMRLAAPLLAVKCVTQVASGAFVVSLGRAKLMASLTLAGGVFNVLLDWLLIPPYGVRGAVYATLIGHTLVGLIAFAFIVNVVRVETRVGSEA